MAERRPNRTLGPNHDTFWEYLGRSEYRLQKCNQCGEFQFPPAAACPECLSDEFTWTQLQGTGVILSHCTFIRQYYPECPVPWHTMLVELDEGPSVIGTPLDQSIDEERLKSGTRVRLALIDVEDDAGAFKLPVWEPIP